MSSWKKTGGINNSSKFKTLRVQNSVTTSSSFIKELGEPNTVTNVNSNLNFKNESSLYATTRTKDNRGLVAFYNFTDVSRTTPESNGIISNQANFNYGNVSIVNPFDHSTLDLEFKDISGNDNNSVIEIGPEKTLTVENTFVPESLITEKQNFLHYNQFIRFEGNKIVGRDSFGNNITEINRCKSLVSKNPINFNNYSVSNRIYDDGQEGNMEITSGRYEHHNTFSFFSWFRINQFGNQNNGFLLFALDDSPEGTPNNDDERLCLWVPAIEGDGYAETPVLLFGGRPKQSNGQGSEACEKIEPKIVSSDFAIPLNKWTMIALVINGNRAYLYQESEDSLKLTLEIDIGEYRIPEKKIIINGARFYKPKNTGDPNEQPYTSFSDGWVTNDPTDTTEPFTQTSSANIDIVDMNIFNFAMDPHTLKRIYEHDNPFFNERVNFRIDPHFSNIGDDLIVGNDIRVNHDLMVSHDFKNFGVLEAYNNAFVKGSLGVGIQHHNPNYRLNVLGNLRASGDLYIGDKDAPYNAIYFKGVAGGDLDEDGNDLSYQTTRIVEQKLDEENSELLFSKGTDLDIPVNPTTGLLSDKIRLRAPNVYIDTFEANNPRDPNLDSSRFVFDQRGRLGVGNTNPKKTLDVSGEINLDDTNKNIFITNDGTQTSNDNAPKNNIGIGSKVFGIQTTESQFKGDKNIAIGTSALENLFDGNQNIAIGSNSLYSNENNNGNIAIGQNTLHGCKSYNNIAIGSNAGNYPINNNIGENNIFIGPNSNAEIISETDEEGNSNPVPVSGSIAIGPGTKISKSNSANIGNSTNDIMVGINKNAPTEALDISGNIAISGSLSLNGSVISFDNITGTEGGGQFVFDTGLKGKGPSLFTDLTLFGSQDYWDEGVSNATDYDFQILNRNMTFSNYPPQVDYVTVALDNASDSWKTYYEMTGIPDKPISFDGNILFNDSYNVNRINDKGFRVKTMDAVFENNFDIGKILTVQKEASSTTSYEPAIVIDPSANTILNNADTTFTNDVVFGDTNIVDSFNRPMDVNGDKSTVYFNNENVNFTDSCKKIFIQNDLDISGNVNYTGSVTVTANTISEGQQEIRGKFIHVDPSYNNVPQLINDGNGNMIPNPDYDTRYNDIGFDISANTLIRGDLTVDGSFNFNNIVQRNFIEEDHKAIRMSERIIIENQDTINEIITIVLTEDQANILNGTDTTSQFPIDNVTINTFPSGTTSNLRVMSQSGAVGSGALVEVIMTDINTASSITISTTGSNYSSGDTIQINSSIDAPALHVTQHGATHNIAEFYDGDLSTNSNNGLVFRMANQGVTDMYGRLGINMVPDERFSLDITGDTRVGGTGSVSTFNNKIYIGPDTSPSPLCTVDISANDAIRIPVGNTTERVGVDDVQEGMVRYNNQTGHLEYYGKATHSQSGSMDNADIDKEWVRVAAGGRISHPDNIFIDVNDTERLTIDTSGNVRIGEGRVQPDARLHIDISGNTDDILKITRKDDDKYKNLITSREITGVGQAIDFTSTYFTTADTSNDYDSMTITPEGKIGFGTKNPEKRIHVVDASDCEMNLVSGENKLSGINLYDILNSNGGRIEYDGSSNKINLFHHNNGYKTTINESGFLGLNTDDPKSLLHIHETSTDSLQKEILRLTNFSDSNTSDNTDDITHQASFKLGKYINNDNANDNNSSMLELHLHNSNPAPFPVIRARSDGSVGINTEDKNMHTGAALNVAGGNIVLGQKNRQVTINNVNTYPEQNRSFTILGEVQDTTMEHRNTNGNSPIDGAFRFKVTPSGTTNYYYPLTFNRNTIKLQLPKDELPKDNGETIDPSLAKLNIDDGLFIDVGTSTSNISTIDCSGTDLHIFGKDSHKNQFIKLMDGNTRGIELSFNDHEKLWIGNSSSGYNTTIDTTGNIVNSGTITSTGDIGVNNKITLNASAGNITNTGTITSTGNIVVNNKITLNSSNGNIVNSGTITTTGTGEFGVAHIGSWNGGSTYSVFVHKDLKTADANQSYALLQYQDGNTFLNAANGKTLHLRIQNRNIATITSSAFNIVKNTNVTGNITNSGTITSTGNITGSGELSIGDTDFHSPQITLQGQNANWHNNVNTVNTGFKIEHDAVSISNKKLTVSSKNQKAVIIDPSNSNYSMVIKGHVYVDGKVTATEADASISYTGLIATLNKIKFNTSDQLQIGLDTDTSTSALANNYMVVAGSGSYNSMYAYGPVITEWYFAAASDARLKENVHTINNALHKTNSLRGVYFNKIGSDRREVGVIAQEVEKVLPEVVNEGSDGNKNVCYANICGLLIEAVKDLSRENNSQTAEISSLKNQVSSLKNDIAQLWDHKRKDDRKVNDQLIEMKRELDLLKRKVK